MMDRRAMIGASALWGLAGAACAREPIGPGPPARDDRLDAARREAGAPAMGAILVGREGTIWSGVSGVRRAGREVAAQIDDRWHLGSNTKAMTALLYGRLVEAGRARWEATAAELFSDLPIDPGWASATAERFMAQVAGLADTGLIDAGWLNAARVDPRPLPEQRRALVARALAAPPNAAPGSFVYANLNYVLIGAAIEAITGVAWEAAMQTGLFTPLGLATAGFGPPPDPAPWGHRDLFGRLTPMDPSSGAADNPQALGPAGTAHMSLADYGRWLRVFLGARPDGFVSDAALARLTRPFDASQRRGYGLGWGVDADPAWAEGVGMAHEGSNTLWRVAALVAPAPGLACAVVANRDTDLCARLAVELMRDAAA